MQVSNLANVPVDMKIGETTFKVKRLSLLNLYGEFESDVKSEYLDNISDLASRVKDIKERIQLQRELMKDMPKGRILEESAKDKMDSVDGGVKLLYLALKDSNEITVKEAKDLSSNYKNTAEINNIIDYTIGLDASEEKEENKEDENAEKKT